MGTVQKQGLIQAPVEAIYNYVASVQHAPDYITAFTEVISGPEPPGPPVVGQRYRVRASFLGNNVVLGLRLARLEPGHLVQLAMEGQPSGTITIELTPQPGDQGTQVSASLDTPQFNSIMLNMVMGGMLEEAMTRLQRTLAPGAQ
jgi:hypothetical protein